MEHPIQHYIADERARCLALARAIQHRPFLFFCIENSYSVTELETARQRLEEMQPVEDIEDLM
jgi:hypothetical protein